jgi:hypothetical protein
LALASAKARGYTTTIFVTELFKTFIEAAIKSALTGKGAMHENLISLIRNKPEFPYSCSAGETGTNATPI